MTGHRPTGTVVNSPAGLALRTLRVPGLSTAHRNNLLNHVEKSPFISWTGTQNKTDRVSLFALAAGELGLNPTPPGAGE